MKKTYGYLLTLAMLLGAAVGCGKTPDPSPTPTPDKKAEPTTEDGKYLITDSEGNYGGTLNESLYGEGTPLNGLYDTKEDEYYSRNDWYNMKSTKTRLIIPRFQSYQQTMADSDGIACAMMILNREGKDIKNEFTEEKLVAKYEQLTGKTVYGNGTTKTGLTSLLTACGLTAEAWEADDVPCTDSSNSKYDDWGKWVKSQLKEDKYILVRYQDGIRYQWHLIIGFEDFGNSDSADDVLIFADPFDAMDHYQDGYSIYHSRRFYHWFKHKLRSGADGEIRETITVDATVPFNFEVEEVDELKTCPTIPELHLLLNKDGTVGGSYGDGRYSGNDGAPGYDPKVKANNGQLDYSYYAYPDYYNMTDTDTRQICENYRAFKQTMSSSCGICSTMSVLEYYGEIDWSTIGQYIKRTDFVGYDKNTNPTFGGVDVNDNGRKQEAIMMIYMLNDPTFALDGTSSSFYNYGGVGSSKLKFVPEVLGYTGVQYGRYTQTSYTPNENNVPFKTFDSFYQYMYQSLRYNEPTIVNWNPTGGHWEVLMAYDDMGTEYIYDDVVVLADSSDGVDHYRDGYNTLPATVFYGTWYNGSGSTNQQYVHFGRKG